MTKKLRFLTGLLAATLAVVLLSSAVYLALASDHDCAGEDCAVCRQISACENLLKTLGLAGAAAAKTAAAPASPMLLSRFSQTCSWWQMAQSSPEQLWLASTAI